MLLKLKKNQKGFTLIELIVVVAIIAILAAIAVPSYLGMQKRATEGVEIANASAIAGAINTYNATLGATASYPADLAAYKTAMSVASVNMWPTLSTTDATAISEAEGRVSINGTSHLASVITTIPYGSN